MCLRCLGLRHTPVGAVGEVSGVALETAFGCGNQASRSVGDVNQLDRLQRGILPAAVVLRGGVEAGVAREELGFASAAVLPEVR